MQVNDWTGVADDNIHGCFPASFSAALRDAETPVSDVIADLDRRYPGLRDRLIDGEDRIRRQVRLFVNDKPVQALAAPIRSGDVLHLVCPLSGG